MEIINEDLGRWMAVKYPVSIMFVPEINSTGDIESINSLAKELTAGSAFSRKNRPTYAVELICTKTNSIAPNTTAVVIEVRRNRVMRLKYFAPKLTLTIDFTASEIP